MARKRKCAREGCSEEFTPSQKNQKYHSPACRRLSARVKETARKPLDQVVAEAEQRDLDRQNARELRVILSSEHRMRRYLDVLSENLQSFEPTELAAPPVQKGLPEHEDILILGDWHIGQKTTIEETGGIYEHTIDTARGQVAKIWKATNRLHHLERHARAVRKLHLLFIGDIIEGSGMRPSQLRKVETLAPQQFVAGFDLLAWLIRQLLTVYDDIELEVIGGNHDRTTQKAGDAGLGESAYTDTWSWLLGATLERLFEEEPRLAVKNWETYFGAKEIMGVKTVFEHGSSFKWSAGGYGGVPWYSVSNLAPKYAAMLGEADLVILGHGHRPAVIPIPNGRGWTVVNGALPATSTYVQAGQKVVSRPQQWRLSAHQGQGITSFQPIYADVPGTVLPGEFWDRLKEK